MQFCPPLIKATFQKRYKRFFTDALLEDGTQITAHCPNPGSMLSLLEEGATCWLSKTDNPKRKLKYTFELIQTPHSLVGVNTTLTNKIVHEALKNGIFDAHFSGIKSIKPEQKYGQNSRIDFLVEEKTGQKTFVEVKNVTLSTKKSEASFPDSVTSRGAKHLEELMAEAQKGNRSIMLFLINREDCTTFTLAKDIDPTYVKTFKKAQQQGVEALAYSCKITPKGIEVHRQVEIRL